MLFKKGSRRRIRRSVLCQFSVWWGNRSPSTYNVSFIIQMMMIKLWLRCTQKKGPLLLTISMRTSSSKACLSSNLIETDKCEQMNIEPCYTKLQWGNIKHRGVNPFTMINEKRSKMCDWASMMLVRFLLSWICGVVGRAIAVDCRCKKPTS